MFWALLITLLLKNRKKIAASPHFRKLLLQINKLKHRILNNKKK